MVNEIGLIFIAMIRVLRQPANLKKLWVI
jgi:hypothetical protein